MNTLCNYQGVYILTEKVKRDNDRVDIAKLDDDDLYGDSFALYCSRLSNIYS